MSHAKQLHNRRYFDDYMEIMNRKGLPGNVKSALCEQVNRAVVGTTQQVIEQALEAELSAYLGAERYEHLPWGREAAQTRSGSYRRELMTQYGRIADLRVPKLRKGNGALEVDGEARDDKAKRKAKTARKKAILADAGTIYNHKTESDMRAQAEVFRETWREREPKSVANFFTDFDKTLAYLRVDFPASLGVLIRTTNRLERFHKEMRRKQRDIGMFQSEEGCEAIWYLIATRETAKQQAALGLRA